MTRYRKDFGQKGEDLAVKYLKDQEYEILEYNFRCRFGEIDIIAKENGDLVFVEVKAKTSDKLGSPEEMVNKRKQEKIIKTAEYYIFEEGLGDISWRIDVVAIEEDGQGNVERLNLIKNAVEERR